MKIIKNIYPFRIIHRFLRPVGQKTKILKYSVKQYKVPF